MVGDHKTVATELDFMDIATIAAFLSPFLPHLVKAGSKAAATITDSAGKKLGEAAVKKAEAVWDRLRPPLEAEAGGQKAIADLQSDPEDEDNVADLRKQLKGLLKQDPALLEAIAAILEEDAPDGTPGTQIVQHVTGDRNTTIGQMTGGKVFGNVEGSVNIKE